MKTPLTDLEIIDNWNKEPAPLLEILHTFQERDGWLTEKVIRKIADRCKLPLADLYGTLSFYDYFSLEPDRKEDLHQCLGPVCLIKAENKVSTDSCSPSCLGRCDQGDPFFQFYHSHKPSGIDSVALPVENPGNFEECVFKNIRQPGISDIKIYQNFNGYQAFIKALDEQDPKKIISEIEASGLKGRGGAGFPTGEKWRLVSEADNGPKSIVCNADEGEPGCFKDRALLYHNPHLIIEGMCLAALATGASRGFIYLRFEYPEVFEVLSKALQELRDSGLLGNKIKGTDFSFQIYLRRGAGAYICGEEGALLNSLEGKRPFTRNKPPFPVTNGFEDLPTVVNNVETLAAVPHIINNRAEWYRGLGLKDNEGTKVISLSGDIMRPGNYEIPFGLPLKTLLYEWAGGLRNGRSLQLVTMAGVSGGFLAGEDIEVCLDESGIREKGSFLGAGGVIVLDDSRDPLAFTIRVMEFFAHESCGKCVPCRSGTRILSETLKELKKSKLGFDEDKMQHICDAMLATSACGLGMAAPNILKSLQKYYPELCS